MRKIVLEVFRFGLVGLVNTGVDFAAFLLLYRGLSLEPLVANTLAFLVAVTNSYLLNHHWTFRSSPARPSMANYLRFLAVNSGGLMIGTLTILLLKGLMLIEGAKLVATGITLIWNYSTSKLIVFKTR